MVPETENWLRPTTHPSAFSWCSILLALNVLPHTRTLHFAAHIRLKVSPSMHARETSSQHRSSLYPLPLALGAAAVRLGEFDINPRWKPADDRLDLALINRAAASRSIDVGDLSGIHDRYISHLVA